MALSLGIHTSVANHYGNSLTTAAKNPNASGSTFVVFMAFPTGASIVGAGVPTDSSGVNTYVQRGSTQLFGFSTQKFMCYDCQNAVGVSNMVWGAQFAGYNTVEMFVVEIKTAVGSGQYATLDAIAGSANNTFTSPTPFNSPVITTSATNDYILSATVTDMGTPATGQIVTDTAGFNNILDTITDGTNLFPGATAGYAASAMTSYNDVFVYGGTSNQSAAAFTVAYRLVGSTGASPSRLPPFGLGAIMPLAWVIRRRQKLAIEKRRAWMKNAGGILTLSKVD